MNLLIFVFWSINSMAVGKKKKKLIINIKGQRRFSTTSTLNILLQSIEIWIQEFGVVCACVCVCVWYVFVYMWLCKWILYTCIPCQKCSELFFSHFQVWGYLFLTFERWLSVSPTVFFGIYNPISENHNVMSICFTMFLWPN